MAYLPTHKQTNTDAHTHTHTHTYTLSVSQDGLGQIDFSLIETDHLLVLFCVCGFLCSECCPKSDWQEKQTKQQPCALLWITCIFYVTTGAFIVSGFRPGDLSLQQGQEGTQVCAVNDRQSL